MNDIPIRKELLDILACPACDDRPKVELREDGLQCTKCGRIYPIENGVPIMLTDKARCPGESDGG